MHTYTRKLLDSLGTALTLEAGDTKVLFEVGYPPIGRITRLVVRQVDSDTDIVAFAVRLYNSDYTATTPVCSEDMAKILDESEGTLSAGGGATAEYASAEGKFYQNLEGTYSVPVRKVYLEIEIAAQGTDTHWEALITCEPGGAQF